MSTVAKLSHFLYNRVFRKTSTFVVLIGVTAIYADRLVDWSAETIFAKINEGRLFKDVKKQLALGSPESWTLNIVVKKGLGWQLIC